MWISTSPGSGMGLCALLFRGLSRLVEFLLGMRGVRGLVFTRLVSERYRVQFESLMVARVNLVTWKRLTNRFLWLAVLGFGDIIVTEAFCSCFTFS